MRPSRAAGTPIDVNAVIAWRICVRSVRLPTIGPWAATSGGAGGAKGRRQSAGAGRRRQHEAGLREDLLPERDGRVRVVDPERRGTRHPARPGDRARRAGRGGGDGGHDEEDGGGEPFHGSPW